MRNFNLKKIVIFFSLICSFSSFVNAEYELLDKIIAVVEKDVVTLSELEKEKEKIKKNQNISQDKLQEDALQNLIERKIIMQYSETININTTPEEIDFVISNILKKNDIELSDLKSDLAINNITINQFRDDIKFNLTLKKIKQNEIMPYVNISEYEVDAWVKKVKGSVQNEYNILHILIKKTSESDNKVKKIFERIPSESFDSLARKFSDGPFSDKGGDWGWKRLDDLPSLFSDQVKEMNEGEIRNFSSGNGMHIIKLNKIKNNLKIEKRTVLEYKFQQILLKRNNLLNDDDLINKINNINNLILNGMKFSDAVLKYSEDNIFQDINNLNWVNIENLLPEFKKEFGKYPKNNILGPFKTELGWHLVNIVDFREIDRTNEFNRESARFEIASAKTEYRFRDWMEALIENSKIKIITD